jgi:hypothetical protein
MALKRGRDEKDFVKDLHDRARNIVAQSKETPRIYNSQAQTQLTDSSMPFQFPLSKTGLNEKDYVPLARRQAQKMKNLSSFYDNPFVVPTDDGPTFAKGNMYFNNKLLFR